MMKLSRYGMVATLALASIALAGPAGATHEHSYAPTNTKLFMRNTGPTCAGDRFLSYEAGSGEPGCGEPLGAPFGELYHAGAPVGSWIHTYSTPDPVSIFVDATRDLTGNVRLTSASMTNRMAVGQIRVDVTVRGNIESGEEIVLGKGTTEKLVNPTNSAFVDFPITLDLADEFDKTRLTKVTVDVDVRGWHVLTGYQVLDGASWVDLATFQRTPIIH